MVKLKEMPPKGKYAMVIDNMKFYESFILPFVQNNLGERAVTELKNVWEEGVKPVPENASFERKYETAYGNWIWLVKSAYSFIRKRMGEDGIRSFERDEVEALKRKNASPALHLLNFIRLFSPSAAFAMTAKQMVYQLQWLTPYSVPELNKTKAVLDIPRCKILDFPGTEDICLVGCQSIYPTWVADQFKVDMKFKRQGNSCIGTLTPLS